MFERIGRELPPEPEIPLETMGLYKAFWDLNNNRSSNGFGLNPVPWFEFEAWQRGTGNWLTNDERKIVMGLFPVFDKAYADIQPKEQEEQ